MKKKTSKPAKKLAALLLLPAFAAFLPAFAEPEYRFPAPAEGTVHRSIAPDDSAPSDKDSLVSTSTKKQAGETGTNVPAKRGAGILSIAVDKFLSADSIWEPGGKDTIILRGMAAGKPPLVIVDGKEQKDGVLESLDPNTVESISILKGTAATSVYGEKGKNGVVIVKTKAASRKAGVITYNITGDKSYDVSGTYITCKEVDKTPPLVMVDGKEQDHSMLNTLDPDRIESFRILKDTTATSVYGEKGKNGVIIIKTKAASGE